MRKDSPKESVLPHEHKKAESSAKEQSKTVAAAPLPADLFSPATPLTKPEAEKLLGIKGDAEWAAIEKSRIQLVSSSAPLPHQEANEVERAATLKRIQRINEAYLILLKARCF